MARDDSQPMIFNLPDGDEVHLITWAFVMKKLESQLTPTINQLSAINSSLGRISDRVDYWLAQQTEDE